MKTNQTYFGLEFAEDFPLDKTTCRKLAKLLYANPSTSPEEAIRIIQNHNLWVAINQLMEALQVELEKVSIIELDIIKEPNIQKLLFDKSFSWIKAFSCPTPKEIIEVAMLYPGIPETLLMNQVERIVTDDNMPPQRIIDYLTKYNFMLSRLKTDSLLDLYNHKIVVINFSNNTQKNKQLKIQLP